MKTKIILIICILAFAVCAFLPIDNTLPVSVVAQDTGGLINLYDPNCTDKTAYGQVIDVTQHYNNVGWVTDNLTTINGQTSYTSGYIDVRGYTYFTTNNDRSFEIICYDIDKEPIRWIAENSSAEKFRVDKDTTAVTPLSLPTVTTAYEKTINNRTLIAINPNWVINDNSGSVSPVHTVSTEATGSIAFVRVAFPNTEQNPYFRAFTDDFEMLIKLNRDDTSGAVMNALMIDINDGVFSGFTITSLNLTFTVGDILKNTSNEIIFSVHNPELYFYYTATNGGWQSILTGIQYFSYYANETVTLNTPTYIAVAPMTVELENNLLGNGDADDTITNNTTNNTANLFNDPIITYAVAIFGGLAVLMLLSALTGGRR
jgi:hypothetical protein